MEPRIASESGVFADSLDAEYRFGRPRVYLNPRELARLSLLRSRLGETTAERQARAGAYPVEIRRHRS